MPHERVFTKVNRNTGYHTLKNLLEAERGGNAGGRIGLEGQGGHQNTVGESGGRRIS